MTLLRLLPDLAQAFQTESIRSVSINDVIEDRVRRFLNQAAGTHSVGPLHTVVRELIQNAIKANLKRFVFDKYVIDPLRPHEYNRGMEQFHRTLSQINRDYSTAAFHEAECHFEIFLSYHPRLSILHICNPGILFPQEEERIRRKFQESAKVEGLYQFYLNYSDLAEGSGMGIAMTHILLKQLGFDPRHLSIFSVPRLDITVSRLLIPASPEYRSQRQRFESLLIERNIEAVVLREALRMGTESLPFLD